MTPLWLQVATFVVLLLTLGAVVWYACLTRKLWKAALEQAEAQLKPCITPATMQRDPTEAVAPRNGVKGETVLAFDTGNLAIRNIGNGPAVHLSYALRPLNVPPGENRARHDGYIHAVERNERATLPIPRGALQPYEFELAVTYQSLSRQRYRTVVSFHDLVLTNFRFESL